MQTREFHQFKELLEHMGNIFNKAPPEEMIRQYFEALKDLPLSVIQSQAKEHTREGKFFPKPRDLRPKEKRSSFDSDERGSGKYPDLWSAEWWQARADWLRKTYPKGVPDGHASNLTIALLGTNPDPDLVAANLACYQAAWPWFTAPVPRLAAPAPKLSAPSGSLDW